jgi:LysM domain-containing protein
LNHFQNSHDAKLGLNPKLQSAKFDSGIAARPKQRNTLHLALIRERTYFRCMKRVSLQCLGAVCFALVSLSAAGQDNAARAAADREAAEERYKLLNSAVEGLVASQADQQRRIAAIADDLRSVRSESPKIDTSKFVTREELNRLVKAVEEIDRKREADKKLILDEFEELKKDLKKLLSTPASAPPPSTSGRKKNTAAEDKPPDKAPDKTQDTAAGSAQEGVWHVIEKDNSLWAIATAYNEEFKKQGKKTSVKLIEDANPGLKATSLKLGQKVFVPLVPQ